ncbi:hypothetical protein [Pandoraea sp. CB10b_02]|uniref:hypothetical protein n=1 Tax=Pandoraea sp. CB10b_02 TaxID=2014535 RepID=UPI00258006AB|nr:hypothetical protein [Pandoraea sp. CB10b_02]
MTRKFAKLYETAIGQIVVMRQMGDDGPEIAFFFDPEVEPLGVCSVKLGFSDDDDGHDKADKAFDAVTEEGAIKVVTSQIDQIKEMFKEAA